ncbi:MAG: S8 family serine peptidase [Candidatus Eisenbacteria bacterium]|nr:S8 family serine peptidase [Candidatus Eisenbacteria bacterium]
MSKFIDKLLFTAAEGWQLQGGVEEIICGKRWSSLQNRWPERRRRMLRRFPASLLFFLVFCLFPPATRGEPLYYVDGELVVKFSDRFRGIDARLNKGVCETGFSEVDQVLHKVGVSKIEREFRNAEFLPRGPEDLSLYFKISFPKEKGLPVAVDELRQSNVFEKIEPIGVYEVSIVPNDPLFSTQTGLGNTMYKDIAGIWGWDIVRGDTSTVIAIVDTGVDWLHPDLSPAIWVNWPEMSGTPGADDDGNGYIDDIRGWDWVDSLATAWPGEDSVDSDSDPMDFNGHGTHVAGIAAAVTDNGAGIAGAGWGSRIMALRAGWSASYAGNEVGLVNMYFCAQAIYYAAAMGAGIINASWDSGNEGGISAAVDYAVSRGVLVVVAAGNHGNTLQTYNYLSTRGDCLDVAGLTEYDCKTASSNYGSWIDISAPGQNIRSTLYDHNSLTHTYGWKSGTSMATAFVTGVASLIKSAHPGLNGSQIAARIGETADDLGDPQVCQRTGLGSGRVNAYSALRVGTGYWKARTRGMIESSPAICDLDKDGMPEVGIGSNDSMCYVYSSSGSLKPGWPVAVSGMVKSSPSIADIDGDSYPDIVFGTSDGKINALNNAGIPCQGWPVTVGGSVGGSAVLADIGTDSIPEIIVCAGESVYVFNRDGTLVPGWPIGAGSVIGGTPSVGDIDGDGIPEIVFGGSDGFVRALKSNGSSSPGWPQATSDSVIASTCLADISRDSLLDIIAVSADSLVYVWDHNGSLLPGWPQSAGRGLYSSPAVSDVDRDGDLEIVVGSSDRKLYCFRKDGSVCQGWPVALGGQIKSSPAILDINGDGKCEIFVGCSDWRLYAFGFDGTPLKGWPKGGRGEIVSSPSIADLNGDGVAQIVAGSLDKEVYVYDAGDGNFSFSCGDWPTFHQNPARTGVYPIGAPSRVSEPKTREGDSRDLSLELLGANPNPFSNGTTVRVLLRPGAGQDGGAGRKTLITITIFDVKGKRVRMLEASASGTGMKGIWWDGKDSRGRALPSGVYFISVDGTELPSKKTVLLR